MKLSIKNRCSVNFVGGSMAFDPSKIIQSNCIVRSLVCDPPIIRTDSTYDLKS